MVTWLIRYYEVVRRPLDLGAVCRRVEDAKYKDLPAFEKDMGLVLDNALAFYPATSQTAKDCLVLRWLGIHRRTVLKKKLVLLLRS